ncbi:MAG: lactonase family protein [Lachnospiraceae bacterium]|nr:lactonase family protein [Lachnospiraceae bacterium]MDD7024343.1 lactonase family protein [Oscillospiraceae bacterium]MDY5541240.1 lactonase family protein [Lachnospiraceae bacterium]MDY5648686.1 lactonase family protein [Lachnospiraceae bacterium]
MGKEKYVAYVGTYTHGTSIGIHLYDLDVENGTMAERKVVPINNSSHLVKAHNKQFLYSISDEGVESFRILPDGDLEFLNRAGIQGMRGCYVSLDAQDKFLFVGGYHDGKVTVLRINPDGSIGAITDGIFHKGLGSVAERNFRPHISCVKMTPDQKYLCAVDNGIDHVNVYRLDHRTGKLNLVDIVRCELESGPRQITFSRDGKFAYVLCELKNYINVYTYDGRGKTPKFEKIQQVDTRMDVKETACAAASVKISRAGNHLYCSSAGDNSVSIFTIDPKSGMLERMCSLPISGSYPKDLDVFPDDRTLVVLNHESNEIRTFRINYEKKLFVEKGRPIKVETPNSIMISRLYE